jgi:hypothetical protein
MPNWCDNQLTLGNSDKSKLDAVEAVLADKENQELFKHLRPFDGDWDYGWCVENWGTKWESRIVDWERLDDNELIVYFETAWGPPIALYEYLYELDEGWNVEAYYHEPGMCFAGMFYEGDDSYYEYSELSADEIEEYLPEILNEMYGIADYKRDWDEENEEEEEELEWPEPKGKE